jgi:serine O-acetyltransferase
MAEDAPISPASAVARRDAGLASVSWEQWSCEYDRMTFGECIRRIREDYAAHGRDWTLPGFRAVAVHRFGNWRMNVRLKILRAPLSILYRMMFRRCRNRYGIELPYAVRLGRRVVIEHQNGIVIHGESVIGDDCIIRQGVTLGAKSVDRPHDAPRLGRGVEVGAGAKILGAVAIGDDAIVGANAVVLCDVPPGATAVGVPAKIIPPK